METIDIKLNGVNYTCEKLLGHGKSGYSYLVKDPSGKPFVLKKIHHEPVSYYTFGDKFKDELKAYKILNKIGVLVPRLIDYDIKQEMLLKEYIEGQTIHERLESNNDISKAISMVREIAKLCRKNNLNIDYYPTNFIEHNSTLYYIDYEVNDYSDTWNFDNWALQYWTKKQLINHSTVFSI